MNSGDSSRNIVAAMSYLLGFVTGIVILVVERDDKFIRFHAMQSIMATGSLFVLNIVIGLILNPLGIFSFLSTLTGLIIWAVIIYICVRCATNAYRGKVYKLPFFGDFAEGKVR